MANGNGKTLTATLREYWALLTVIGMMVSGAGGAGIAITDMNARIKSLEVAIGDLRDSVRSAADDRYRAEEAARDFALRDTRIESNSTAIDRLAEQISSGYSVTNAMIQANTVGLARLQEVVRMAVETRG